MYSSYLQCLQGKLKLDVYMSRTCLPTNAALAADPTGSSAEGENMASQAASLTSELGTSRLQKVSVHITSLLDAIAQAQHEHAGMQIAGAMSHLVI